MAVTLNASTSTGLVQSADTSGEIELQSNGTTALTVNTNEGIQILNCLGVGNATPSTSGAGITFPASQSASTDANTLDDYEEGTFTVAVRGSSTAGTYTITSQSCTYTKIGRLVYLNVTIGGFSTASGGAGYFQITGCPFTIVKGNSGSIQGNSLDFSSGTLFAVADVIGSGNTILYIREIKDNTAGGDFAIGGISTSTTALIISYVFEV